MTELTPEERQRIFEEEKARKEAQEELKLEEQAKNGKTIGIGCLGLIAIIIILSLLLSMCGSKDAAEKPPHDPISAFYMSQQFTTKQLKAPATAKYPAYSEAQVLDLGDGQYRISAYVDAQNAFGAMIRTQYLCTVKHVEGDTRQLLEFEFQ